MAGKRYQKLAQQAREYHRARRYTEAERCYRQALAGMPNDVPTLHALAVLLRQSNRAAEAIDPLRQALRFQPRKVELHNELCVALTMLGRAQEAIDAADEAIRAVPGSPVGYFQKAQALLYQSRPDEAIPVLEAGIEATGRDSFLVRLLAMANAEHGEMDAAVPLFREALDAQPESLEIRTGLATALRGTGELGESLAEYERVLEKQPDDLRALAGKAETLESMGRRDEAKAILDRALRSGRSSPELILAYGRLCRLMKQGAQAVPMLRQLLQQPGLPPRIESGAQMLLGAILEDTGNYDEAFACYQKGNRDQERPFDAEALVAAANDLKSFFTKGRLASLPSSGSTSTLPLFIVGMPRSGTSLVEQILASHPAVFGAGERQDWTNIALAIPTNIDGVQRPFPQNVQALTAPDLERMAQSYLEELRALASEASMITDKNPFNFMNLGLIQMVVPQARVIHCIRHPLDVCVSCFASRLSAKNNYANSLESIAIMYRQYHELMLHWREHLSLPMLEVPYEETVTDLEGTVRRLLDFCDLEFDDRCLQFYETRRHTRTASTDQVRQPIYQSSMARYRRFEPYLDELKRDLADILN